MDDGALVLLGTAAMLEDLGHAVVLTNSATEALSLLDGGCAVDLVLTDHAMPGMMGWTVCGKAARTVLCGGRSVMSVPTAIRNSTAKLDVRQGQADAEPRKHLAHDGFGHESSLAGRHQVDHTLLNPAIAREAL